MERCLEAGVEVGCSEEEVDNDLGGRGKGGGAAKRVGGTRKANFLKKRKI